MKKVILSLLLLIVLTGCSISNKQEEVCKNCVFAHYTIQRQYGKEGNTLEEYTKDYKTLKNESNEQRNKFLGHILDKDGKILRGFVCGIKQDKIFCLEGSMDGSTYETNKKTLEEMYDTDKCVDADSSFQCNDGFYAIIYKNGDALIDNKEPCFVTGTKMFCW